MRFAIATVDRYLGVFEALVFAGWRPTKLFTVPLKTELGNQRAVIGYAEQQRAAIQLSRLTKHDMQELRDQGCEALIVAGYDWKIPDWTPYLKYAVNFHPSPLPEGRGPYPSIRAVLENRKSWAVTCHRLAPEMDSGDVLAVETFPLEADECHEKLDLKIQMAAKKLAMRLMLGFDGLWAQAKPQSGGSYWPHPTLADRFIDFNWPVERIMRHIRAFGAAESLAHINGGWFIVKRAVGWPELHNLPPGVVAHMYNRTIVMAASDGYIGLLEWGPVSPEVLLELQKNPPMPAAAE